MPARASSKTSRKWPTPPSSTSPRRTAKTRRIFRSATPRLPSPHRDRSRPTTGCWTAGSTLGAFLRAVALEQSPHRRHPRRRQLDHRRDHARRLDRRRLVHPQRDTRLCRRDHDPHVATIAHVATTIDGYLFATILIIFALGLYELFIGKIDAAEQSEIARRLLLIHSIDDLKERLAKVVFLILLVRYFEFALQAEVTDSAVALLYFAIGVALVALAIYLTSVRRPT